MDRRQVTGTADRFRQDGGGSGQAPIGSGETPGGSDEPGIGSGKPPIGRGEPGIDSWESSGGGGEWVAATGYLLLLYAAYAGARLVGPRTAGA